MSEERGFLTKDLEKLAKDGLDELIKAKGLTEMATDAAIAMFVPLVDNNIADHLVDEEIKTPIREAGQLIYDGKDDEATERLSVAISIITEFEETDTLKLAYKKQLEAFIMWIKVGIEKRKS